MNTPKVCFLLDLKPLKGSQFPTQGLKSPVSCSKRFPSLPSGQRLHNEPERSTILNGKTHNFAWAMFNSYVTYYRGYTIKNPIIIPLNPIKPPFSSGLSIAISLPNDVPRNSHSPQGLPTSVRHRAGCATTAVRIPWIQILTQVNRRVQLVIYLG